MRGRTPPGALLLLRNRLTKNSSEGVTLLVFSSTEGFAVCALLLNCSRSLGDCLLHEIVAYLLYLFFSYLSMSLLLIFFLQTQCYMKCVSDKPMWAGHRLVHDTKINK